MNYYGSICLSDAQAAGMIKKADNGKLYLNIRVVERREVGKFGDTHFISCEPNRMYRVEGVNYICGNLRPFKRQEAAPTSQEIDEMPAATEAELPF